MKKTFITLLMVAALMLGMTITALADELKFELPTDGDTIEQGGALAQWITSGTDEKEVPLTWETLRESSGIVFEMPEDPEWWVGIIFGAFQPGSGWDWDGGQRDALNYHFADGKLIVWWIHNEYSFEDLTEEDYAVKMLFGQWGVDWEEHGITNVYLTDLEPIELRILETPADEEPAPDEPEPAADEPEPTPTPEPVEPEPIMAVLEDDMKKDEGGLPVWAWILIGVGGAVAIGTGVAVAVKSKK